MATAARFYTVLIVFLAVSHVAFTLRFKIAIPEEGREALRHRLTKRTPACEDYKEEKSKEKLAYPKGFEGVDEPWEKLGRAVVYSSAEVTKGMEDMFRLKVPGLKGVTIKQVLDHLQEKKCLSFPYGGCIRDQFLQKLPGDLDMETNCDHKLFNQICVAKWGAPNCKSGRMAEHIGSMADHNDLGNTDIIDAANWQETFFGYGKDLEYTTNSIAYFASGKDIVIDLTGTGVSDTCQKLIRIPVSKEQREAWHSDIKIFRYWKLRVKEYDEADQDTLKYIAEQAVDMMEKRGATFKRYYCTYALLGHMVATCQIPVESCPDIKKQAFDKAFAKDLKADWDKTGKGLVNKMECDSCPNAPGC